MLHYLLGLGAFVGLAALFVFGVDATMKIKVVEVQDLHFKCMSMCESSRGQGFEDIQKKSERICYALCNRKYK